MSLGFRWAFIVLVVAYGLSAMAAVENFNEMIAESEQGQKTLASEIQKKLDIKNEKNSEGSISKETIAAQSFKVRLIRK